jgi:hypothetical protein
MVERMGGNLPGPGVDYTGVLKTAESMGLGSLEREVRRLS